MAQEQELSQGKTALILKEMPNPEFHHLTCFSPRKLWFVPEEHAERFVFRVRLPVRQFFACGIHAIGIAGFNEVRPIAAHFPGEIVVFANKGPPALGQCLEKEPQVNGMECPWVVRAWYLSIKVVVVKGNSQTSLSIGPGSHSHRVFNGVY